MGLALLWRPQSFSSDRDNKILGELETVVVAVPLLVKLFSYYSASLPVVAAQ